MTNLRSFLLVERGSDGQPTTGESYHLAQTELEFWGATLDLASLAATHAERFDEYLRRMLLHRAPLAAPKDVAFFLASYARDARARIEHRALPGLTTVRTALEDALGLRFEGEKGDHFFRSTLVQTLFYGVFSAWVLWSKGRPPADKTPFDWRTAAFELQVPAIQVLFEQVAAPSRLGPLGLDEVLTWAGGGAQSRRPRCLLRPVRGRPRRPVLLGTVPRRVRPGASQRPGRLVHPGRSRPLHGRPR